METVIGIDLGTTNSCAAVVENGTPVVIPNTGGHKTIPSVVAVREGGRRLVGPTAKRQAVINAENTVFAFKRLIGRRWASPEAKAALEALPYRLVEGPHGDVRVRLGTEVWSIQEISAQVLQEMKTAAEDYLGRDVDKAVVTVPAYFNDNQRQATKDAGRIAGLDVIRIINEPTAAALAYGFGKDMEKKIAVYDLGGGTFDISILDIGEGVFDVIRTAGDTFLGGEDFDRRIIDWLVFGFAKKHKVDLSKNRMALQRLKGAAEKAKQELSTAKEIDINLPFIISVDGADAVHLQRTLTRHKLEELTADLVDKTIQTCSRTMREAGVDRSQIDEVVLVGGMTRMPKVREAVASFFEREPCKGVHPDEVVAVGAAIQGHALVDESAEILLLDVTPHSLGIKVAGGEFHKLIEENTTVPTSTSRPFTTIRDNQTSVKIVVMQGENERAEENELLGEFILAGLRAAPRGEVEIAVTFEINTDGLVKVSARDVETGKEQSTTVTAGSGLKEEEIRQMTRASREHLLAGRQESNLPVELSDLQKVVGDVERILPKVRETLCSSDLGKATVEKVEGLLRDARESISSRDTMKAVEARRALSRTFETLKEVAAKLGIG